MLKNILSICFIFHLQQVYSFTVSFPTLFNNKAIISNIDVSKLTKQDQSELKILFDKVPLLVFKDQKVKPRDYYNLCCLFDDKHTDEILHPFYDTIIQDTPQVTLRGSGIIKDLYGYKNKEILNGDDFKYNHVWHQDLVGKKDQLPPVVSGLYNLITPSVGGDTLFASLEDAYDNMDYSLQQGINDLNVEYTNKYLDLNFDYSGINLDLNNDIIETVEPFVTFSNRYRTRKSLMISPNRFVKFDLLDYEDSKDLLRNVMKKYVLHHDNIIEHKWEDNDLVIFNNRKLIHTSSPTCEYSNENRCFMLCFLGTTEPIKMI